MSLGSLNLGAPQPLYISFSAEINLTTTESLIAMMFKAVDMRVQEAHLLLSTTGGDVTCGVNLYNVLRGLPFHLTTHNVSNVDSIGSVVFLAGDSRYACKHTSFMFHGVGWQSPGGNADTLRELQDRLSVDQDRIANIIVERTKLTRKGTDAMFREATTKHAADAVGLGIIDEVREVKIPSNALTGALTFPR